MSTIALSVICKNEEDHVDRFFGSIDFSQFDQVVVIDTGSTDKTLEKIEAWRPKIKDLVVKEIEWKKDFSYARQVGMDLCSTEFMMWADFDDILEGTENIKRLMHEVGNTVDAISCKYNYVIDKKTGEVYCELWRERIVRKNKFRWKARLHEVLITDDPSVISVESDLIVFNHFPREIKETAEEKARRNIEILELQREDDPDEPRTYFYLGNYYMGVKDYDNAIKNYLDYIKRSEWDLERYQAACRVCRIYINRGRFKDTKALALQCIDLMPEYPMAYYVMGELYMHMGDANKALEFMETGLSKPIPKLRAAENPADYTYIPKVMKLDALFELRRYEEAYRWGKKIDKEVTNEEIRKAFGEKMLNIEEMAFREKLEFYMSELRSYLIQNDEILKAKKLTECVPYTFENSPRIKQMKVFDKLNLTPQTHDNIDAVEKGYTDKNIIENLEKHNTKAAWLWQWLQRHPEVKSILDVGCNWGWFPLWLSKKGYKVVGVDMNEECLQIAEEKKKEYESDVIFFKDVPKDGIYDLVISFDVIEHVEDDADFVDTLMEHTKKHLIIATPNGCFSRGFKHDAKDGTTQPHLRVYTPKSLKEVCSKYYVDIVNAIHGGLMLIADIVKEEPPKKKLAIYCRRTPDPWGPDSLIRGVGGSEEAVILLTKELKRLGYDITVFNPTPFSVIEGVQWLDPEEIDPNDYYDVFISWRNGDIFMFDNVCGMGKKYIWMHDVPRKDLFNKKMAERIDGVFVLSEYHKGLLPEYVLDKSIVTANGLDLEMINSVKKDNKPHKMVWTSSYLRNLEWLLKAWKEIRKEVPDAELHIMYGWETTDAAPPFDPDIYRQWREEMNKLMDQDGITHHGRIPQIKVLEIMGDSGVFPYLTMFPEISCISCMKAQAMGAIPFTTDTGALKETNRAGIQVVPEIKDNEYTNYIDHIEHLTDLLKDEKRQKKLRIQCFKEALDFSWKKVAHQWNEVFRRD
jgi:2-polyprenyl-3-methyl-5-hydroxy-6-metoxy-1,4-benzoquinol methylase/glycosyltransferase involved in cell wall biosynthesis